MSPIVRLIVAGVCSIAGILVATAAVFFVMGLITFLGFDIHGGQVDAFIVILSALLCFPLAIWLFISIIQVTWRFAYEATT